MNTICYLFIFIFEQFISYLYFKSKYEFKRKTWIIFICYFISLLESRYDNLIKYPRQICDSYSVIGHRFLLFLRMVDSGHNIFAVKHAASALYDKIISCQIIREVRRLFIDSNTGQRDLFNNMRVKLTPDLLAECSDKSNIAKVYESLKRLRKRDVEIDNEDVWMNTGYVTMVKHDKRANIYEVEVSSEIMPYLVALAENFTSYDLTVAISLKSAYSQRFYEYCCQFKNRTNKTFFFSVDDLKKMMMLEDKKGYDNSSNFKTKVLDVAQKELKEAYDNGQSDLYFDYQVHPMSHELSMY